MFHLLDWLAMCERWLVVLARPLIIEPALPQPKRHEWFVWLRYLGSDLLALAIEKLHQHLLGMNMTGSGALYNEQTKVAEPGATH